MIGSGDLRRAVVAEECRRSLYAFVRRFWFAVEPRAALVEGWWMEALCRHLEAVADGRIKRLLVNCPPGFSKSLCLNAFFPAWEWGPLGKPQLRYVSASYSQGLTERDNVRMQQIVLSPLYQELWGDRFRATENRVKFANDKTGWKFATSVGGIGTGERGDRVLIDDPNNIREVESATIREGVNLWLTEVMPTRLNNPSESAIVVIQQRTHEDDATGCLLERGTLSGWEHLMVPMWYDGRRHCRTSIGWEDPRTVEGELAWPERFPEKAVARDAELLGDYGTSGQFQQEPSPRGGGIVQVDWWQLWPPKDDGSGEGWAPVLGPDQLPVVGADGLIKMRMVYPEWTYLLLAVDTAQGERETNDWSACTVWGVWEDRAGTPRLMLVEAWRERVPLHRLVERVMETARRRKADLILVEEKTNGPALATELGRLMRDGEWTVRLFNPGRQDKVARLAAVEPLFAGKVVFAPPTRWARLVIDEVAQVPKGKHDDLADTVSMALLYLRKVGLAKLAVEKEPDATPLVIGGARGGIAQQYGVA